MLVKPEDFWRKSSGRASFVVFVVQCVHCQHLSTIPAIRHSIEA